MPPLGDDQLHAALAALPGWGVVEGRLVKAFTFDIRWTTVTIRLVTHSEGGITEMDLALAGVCDRLAAG